MNKAEEHLYFIAIVLPSPILEQVTELKSFVADNFASKAALRSPAHITLQMPFKKSPDKEPLLISFLNDFAQKHVSIPISLKNYNAFTPRVIYIDVEENQALWQLQKSLQEQGQSILKLNQSTYRNQGFHPHVTIAFRDLKKSMFTMAWEFFKDKSFEATFVAERLALLKHDGTQWQVHHEANLI
jgi:2'-5' RNA ligase